MGTQKNRLNETILLSTLKYSQFYAKKLCRPMYYVEYGKNGSKLIFSEKDGYLSQFAGSYELEVPFKSDKVTSHFSQYRKLTTKTFTFSMASQVKRKSRTRQKQVSIMGDSH